jgi:hypothetical protein
MGDKSNRTSKFLQAHPLCCFCGGSVEAVTIDHVPARTFFWKRIGPEGFEFPACQTCQSASRLDELVFGFYARLMDRDDGRYDEKDASHLLQGVMNNAPSLMPKLDLSPRLKRRALRDYGLDVPEGEFLDEVPLAGVPKEFHAAATIVGRKLALATRYKELGSIAGLDSVVLVRWSQLQIPAGADLFSSLESILPNRTIGARVNTDIGDQFSYAWGLNEPEDLFAICAQFCGSLMLLCAVAPKRNVALSRHPNDWISMTGQLPELVEGDA